MLAKSPRFHQFFTWCCRILLDADQILAEFCRNSPSSNPGKILKNTENLRLGPKNRRRYSRCFDTSMISFLRVGRWTMTLCKIKTKIQLCILENIYKYVASSHSKKYNSAWWEVIPSTRLLSRFWKYMKIHRWSKTPLDTESALIFSKVR